jgi:hypothetical protein
VSYIFDSLVQTITDAAGTAAASYAQSMNPLSSLIRAGSEIGMSGRSILASYRAAGGSVANATFWNLRQATLSSRVNQSQFGELLTGDQSSIGLLAGGKAGQYRIDFTVHVRRVGSSGLPEYTTTKFTMLQNVFDLAGAMDEMSRQAGLKTDPGSDYGAWIGYEVDSVSMYQGK